MESHQNKVAEAGMKTPYGVPYEPYIWGAGWGIQRFGVNQYLVLAADAVYHDQIESDQ